MNYVILNIEVETFDGKIFKQPNCRIKTTPTGNIMCLVRDDENSSWRGVKGKVKINDFKLKKEFYIHKNKTKIPMWLIKIFGVKL